VRVTSRSWIALLVAAAAAAAALSHWVIDVVADYLVPHASFDDFAGHSSRGLIAVVAVALALGLALRGLRRCCDAVAGRGSSPAKPPAWWILAPFAATTFVLACCAVPAMEAVDARLAGETVDGLADAFGGSILLGVVTTAVCAAFVAGLLFGAVRWLLSHRDRIIAAIASVIRRRYARRPSPQQLRRFDAVVVCQPRLAAFRRGKRAPPRRVCKPPRNSLQASRGDLCFFRLLRRAASSAASCKHLLAHRSPTLS
jgi:hypothetical protein